MLPKIGAERRDEGIAELALRARLPIGRLAAASRLRPRRLAHGSVRDSGIRSGDWDGEYVTAYPMLPNSLIPTPHALLPCERRAPVRDPATSSQGTDRGWWRMQARTGA